MMRKEAVTVAGSRDWEREFGFHPAVRFGNFVYLTGHVGCDSDGVCVRRSGAAGREAVREFAGDAASRRIRPVKDASDDLLHCGRLAQRPTILGNAKADHAKYNVHERVHRHT